MGTQYFKRTTYGVGELYRRGLVQDEDNCATIHYYGVITLRDTLPEEEADRLGLVLADSAAQRDERESDALYNAEMRYSA